MERKFPYFQMHFLITDKKREPIGIPIESLENSLPFMVNCKKNGRVPNRKEKENVMSQKPNLVYRNTNHSTEWVEREGVPFLQFPLLKQFESQGLIHGFSTRLGGVSTGDTSSMNLSFSRGDKEENVRENYRRIGKAIGFEPEKLVFSDQIHEDTIYIVKKEDAGKGFVTPKLLGNDGLLTKERGIPLVTFYADCVPLFFYDPVEQVIGMAHSGWRGTVLRIGAKMVKAMEEHYGSKAENVYVVIAPSICQECYEISEDVALEFQKEFEDAERFLKDDHNGKYHLDLWRVNELLLKEAGILNEHLVITDLCTCCNKDVLFSHRASHGKRGNLAGFMMLK